MDEVFPSIQGKNLNKRSLTVPDDFSGKNIFIIVAFLQWQQRAVDEVIEQLRSELKKMKIKKLEEITHAKIRG